MARARAPVGMSGNRRELCYRDRFGDASRHPIRRYTLCDGRHANDRNSGDLFLEMRAAV